MEDLQIGQLLTTAQASEAINVPVPTLRWWRHAGTGPKCFKLGLRKVMYRKSDLMEWVESQYTASQESA